MVVPVHTAYERRGIRKGFEPPAVFTSSAILFFPDTRVRQNEVNE